MMAKRLSRIEPCPLASAQKLKEVFFPPGKSDAVNIEFERRVQLPQENPDMYFNDKKRIFEVAYQEGMRDW